MDKKYSVRRFPFLLLAMLLPSFAFAIEISDGGVNYSLTAQALEYMTTDVLITMGYVVGVLYSIASLLAIYNATVIYVKLQSGEEGFIKSLLTLIGAMLFLIVATIVLPAFFGYNYGSGAYS